MITVQNEEEVLRNNQCLEPFVRMVVSCLKSLTMLKLTRFNHVSQEKFQLDLLSVLIQGKIIPELAREDKFIVLSIMVKNSIVMKKEIISMVWKDNGDFSNENFHRRVE